MRAEETTAPTTVDVARFASMIGVAEDALTPGCRSALDASALQVDVLRGPDRERELLRALRAADDPSLPRSGPHRAADWERGWRENLDAFEAAAGAVATLRPKYNRHHVLRLQGDYVRTADPGAEYAVYTALRHHVFTRWFRGLDGVAEFGCGTGTSLLLLAELFPQLTLWGLDWATSSQGILARLAERTGRPLHARRFDFFAPDASFFLPPGTGVLTSAALEQVGPRHEAFVDWLLSRRPAICVHIEPIVELYGDDTLFDEVARRYHRRRGYLEGFLPRLQQLAAERRIELLEVRRTGFGSFHHEGYSLVVWRPLDHGGAR